MAELGVMSSLSQSVKRSCHLGPQTKARFQGADLWFFQTRQQLRGLLKGTSNTKRKECQVHLSAVGLKEDPKLLWDPGKTTWAKAGW